MRKRSQKKLPISKTVQHRARKDSAVAPKRKKEVCHKNLIKKDTAILGNCVEIDSPIVSHSRDEGGESFAAPDKKTPAAIDCQKLLRACPEEPVVGQAIEAQLKNPIEIFVTRPDLETLEKIAATLKQQVRSYIEEITSLEIALAKEKADRIAAEEKARIYVEQAAQLQEQLKTSPESTEIKGACNCCDKNDIPEERLVKIDSGQRMCPACLAELMVPSPSAAPRM